MPSSPQAWADGLRLRFEADGYSIDDDALAEVAVLGEGHPRATMLVAQQTHAAGLARRSQRIRLGHVRHGPALAIAADSASLDGDIERIRPLGKNMLPVARTAAGRRPYSATAASAAVGRALDALHNAGHLAHRARREWSVVDPLLRRRLLG